MKGYKGMTKDMTCRGMKFEIGKTYHVDGDINLCKNGLHFCEELIDVLDYYGNYDGNRFFEIDADGVIKTNGKKSATSSLTVIREINDIELNRAIYGHGKGHGGCYCYDYGNGYEYGYGYCNGYNYYNGNGYGDGYDNGDGNGYGYGNYGNIQRIIKYV